jgi:hypothetical protein
MVVLVLECEIGVEVLWSLTEGCDVEIGRAAKIICGVEVLGIDASGDLDL